MKTALIGLALWLLATAAVGAGEVGSDGQPLNGMAPLYAPFTFASARGIEAVLTLPDQNTNKDWYANWVMIVGTAATSNHQVFVQVGVIRRPGLYDGGHAFVALQGPTNSRIVYSEWGALADGAHTFAIDERADGFTAFVDGKQVAIPVTLSFTHAYAEVGPEVYAEGDQLVGDVRAVVARAGESTLALRGADVCHYLNHGVELVFDHDAYHAHGTFDRKKASRFEGKCAGI